MFLLVYIYILLAPFVYSKSSDRSPLVSSLEKIEFDDPKDVSVRSVSKVGIVFSW